MSRPVTDDEIAVAIRAEVGPIVTALARWCGDLDVAEEAVADSVVAALETWPTSGLPDRPGGWLHTTARRKALDRLRRIRRFEDRLPLLAREPSDPRPFDGGDDRLALLFACCHPTLGRDARLALTLRAVAGLTTRQIARAFLTTESTITRRISRAKQKIVTTGIALHVPPPELLAERLETVLQVVYLMFNEGYLATSGPTGHDHDLAEDAIWLAALLAGRFPDQPEAIGLQALLTLLHARVDARWDGGTLVVLERQDRSRWDHAAIARGIALVERAATFKRPGRFQLQAAIAAVHGEALTHETTDWPQIVVLYDLLRRHDDSPVVRLNRSVALAHVAGPAVALADVDVLEPVLRDYHLFHAVRAHLLRQLDRTDEARAADERALALTENEPERTLIAARLGDDG